MKKLLKILKHISIGILSLIILFIIFCLSNNFLQLKKESSLTSTPSGTLVDVDSKKIHVYTEGSGDTTCVFMSGLGCVAPEVEMKPLYEKLTDKYKIAVVDRAGYGFSSFANDSRDIDTIVNDTRTALKQCNLKAPYVLFAHSISGVEATYWAQKYPDEVKAIIGLDMETPSSYKDIFNDPVESKNIESASNFVKIQSFLVKLGVHRLFPDITYDQEVLNSSELTEDDKKLYKALTNKDLSNKEIVNELKSLKENITKSVNLELPKDTPICMFIAAPLTEEEKVEKADSYNQIISRYTDYLSQFKTSELIESPGEHSIYLYSPEKIAQNSIDFLNSIEN